MLYQLFENVLIHRFEKPIDKDSF